jgi:DNA repair protein RadC
MCKVADKSYKELCEVLLGQEAYKVSELTAQKLYRLEDTDELKAYGLDQQKAEAFLCGVELGKRAFAKAKAEEKRYCCSPQDLAEFMMPKLRYLNHEEFWVIAADSKNRIIDAMPIVKGTLTNCYVHPREVFKFAIMKNAASIFVAHNHPSGETSPSVDDKKLTKCIVESGNIIGIPCLDHIIIGDGVYYSFQEDCKM